MTKKFQTFANKRNLLPIAFVALLAGAGLVFLNSSSAATVAVSAEAESGTLSGNTTPGDTAGASGGSSIKFGTGSGGGGTGGGVCNTPFANTSVARGDIDIPGTNGLFQVRNEAWNDSHGPQTIYACNEQSWYVTSNQPNNGGAVETYPDSLYNISGNKTIAQYTSITSTFAEQYTPQGGWNAAYDNWMNNFSKEVMIWNEWNGSPGYWPSIATTAVSLGGEPYHFYNNGGELMFFRDHQVKSGSVDILAAYKWLITQNLLKSTDVPTQIEYGVEICDTAGKTQRFDTTGFTVSLQ
jgi:hypothetical protein